MLAARQIASVSARSQGVREFSSLVSKSKASWEGQLVNGKGTVKTPIYNLPYTFESRFKGALAETHTTPEQLLASTVASCFSMALSAKLTAKSKTVQVTETECVVTLDSETKAITIEKFNKTVAADVSVEDFNECVEAAHAGCPISQALKNVGSVKAELVSSI